MARSMIKETESILDKLGIEQTPSGGNHNGLYFLLDMHEAYQPSYVMNNNVMVFPTEGKNNSSAPVTMVEIYQGILEYVSRNRFLMAPSELSGLAPVLEDISNQMQHVAHKGQRDRFLEITNDYEQRFNNKTYGHLNPIRAELINTREYFQQNNFIEGHLLTRPIVQADLVMSSRAQNRVYA
jgi:hypothetical protein